MQFKLLTLILIFSVLSAQETLGLGKNDDKAIFDISDL